MKLLERYSMKRLLMLSIALLLNACSSQHLHVPPTTTVLNTPPQRSGAATAQALQRRYDDSVANCGLASMPAFLCSGVMLRGTQYSPLWHVWDPSPGSVSSGGVAFSYLRNDAKIKELSVNTVDGLIFAPWLQATDKYHAQVQCAFAVDGFTERRSEQGCGPSIEYPTSSDLCHRQDIQTAAQWKVHYESIPASGRNRQLHQCAFSVRDSDNNFAANNFYQALAAQRSISSLLPNELRVNTWPQGLGQTLPLEAFFYLEGSAAGLQGAKYNQQDLYNSTPGHRAIPIVRLKLPTTSSTSATFSFIAADQVVPIP